MLKQDYIMDLDKQPFHLKVTGIELNVHCNCSWYFQNKLHEDDFAIVLGLMQFGAVRFFTGQLHCTEAFSPLPSKQL